MGYLGVPLFIGEPKRLWLIPWADKIKSKLESWKSFSLSMACRLCLIDSVITSSFLHSFQVYRWSSSLLKDLNAAIQNFFWTGSIDDRNFIQVAWKSCCRPKDGGGLGVKDLGILNKAMLKKFTWRMLTEESFVFTYLRAWFFTQDHKPRTWSSLQPPLDSVVGDIYSDATGWNIPTSFKASYPDVAYEIQNVMVSTDLDSLVWTCSLDGSVSYKSDSTSLSEIPTDIALHARGYIFPSRYRFCCAAEEDLRHLFRDCPFVRGLWDAVSSTFGRKLKIKLLLRGKIVFVDALSLLWHFVRKADSLQSGTMKNSVDELQILQRLHVSGRLPKAPRILEVNWRPPPPGCLKVNTDGTAFGSPGLVGCAGVFRTCRVFVKGFFVIPLGVCFAFEAKLVVAVYAFDYA
ncbi:hypothetical protein Ddye_008637 [Dipteronia dyeriana]|uniref:Reverse transcriptase zinc-binding domain-containing protein n=1 Tax=Dipteronia dyeriana TaxID=168575 RepID=A0AAE0CLH7_9ROSI|nr:hypothetical protein Ddye_008637 [Dipteronia dyeriana]